MPDFSFLPTFLAAFANSWISLMSGVVGVALFVGSLIAEWRKKPITFRFLFSFAVLAGAVACYEVWRTEYARNIGEASFSFSDLYPQNANNETVDVRLTVHNETEKPIEIEELRIVRVWASDPTPWLTSGPQRNWCKEINVSPRMARQQRQPTAWAVPNGDAWFDYLGNTKVLIDGTERPSEALIIEPHKGYIFSLTATGITPTDPNRYNGAILCPVVIYSAEKKRHGIVCPGAGEFTSHDPVEHTQSFSLTGRWHLHMPPDDACRGLNLL